jgi:hypothetical protein
MKRLPDLTEIPKPLTKRFNELEEIKNKSIVRICVKQKKSLKVGRKSSSKNRFVLVDKEDSLKDV